jgi:hypothetical protein
MNANNSFRTSITVLTVATIVGCVVILFSGFSQFRLRSSIHEKSLVSSADQKLRNRFGEFYPTEQRVAVAEPGKVAASTSSGAQNVIHSASRSSTFDEVVTTTSGYDTSEVVTSWSSGASVGTSAGTPQVSVPVTINVNNGDLMATLIETREKLAEMKVQQSAIRDSERVFSYEVHKNGEKSVERTSTSSGISVAASKSSEVRTEDFESRIEEKSSVRSAKAEVKSTENTGPATTAPEFSIEEETSFESIAPPQMPATRVDDDAKVPLIEPISYNVEETVDEPTRVTPSARVAQSTRVTSSTAATESSRGKQSSRVSEVTVVQFAPLDDAAAGNEAPASLPELSFEDSFSEDASDVPVLSIESNAVAAEVSKSQTETANSEMTSAEPSLPDFFAAETNATVEQSGAARDQSSRTSNLSSIRTREELSQAFAAVRGLPPEDLFDDPTSEFVMPMVAAEPVPETPVPEIPASEVPATEVPMPPVIVDSPELASAADSADNGKSSPTTPPMISFIESAGDRLVVHPSSAASPVELEFGEPSTPGPALSESENPGRPSTPAMPLAEQQPERWHKYRSRVHQRFGSTPTTPVPPAPEVAVNERSELLELPRSSFNEPALVPPAVEDSLAESGLNSSDIGNTITDSPLMFPDEDGTTEIAQNSDSEKLSSSSLPPIPELAPVPVLGEHSNNGGSQADGSLVYEPQPVMERIHEIHSEMNSSPMVSSSSPMMAPRRMPEKSANDMPFATTFRRISKRVSWMSDAMHSSDKKMAQHKPSGTNSPTKKPAQPGSPRASHSHGPAVARKSSPSQPMQLPKLLMPKLTAPKFTVQNFALPKVNFRNVPAPSFQMPMLDTPDWLACPPDVLAPVRNSTTLHRVMSTVQFAGQPQALK